MFSDPHYYSAELGTTGEAFRQYLANPSPYRMLEFTPDGKLSVTTRTIDSIDYDTNGIPFPQYSRTFVEEGIQALAPKMLAGVLVKQGMTPAEANETSVQNFRL